MKTEFKIWDKDSALKVLLKRIALEEYPLPEAARGKIREVFGSDLSPSQVVDRIIQEVKERGDEAIFDLIEKIDGYKLEELEVHPQEIDQAVKSLPPQFLSALQTAAERVKAFHTQHPPPQIPGAILRPLKKVGVYIPAGYFSSLLMSVIPAKAAEVDQVLVTTPAKDGEVSPEVLAAAKLSRADKVFKVGGVQGIAALAFGTQTIPQVDKICGPGNIFVQLAKKKLYGIVDIDGLYGPSELMVLSDGSYPPQICASEVLAQLEHDPLSSAILITTDRRQAEGVLKEIEMNLPNLPRKQIIAQSLSRSGIVVVNSLEEGVEIVNYYAPEHLLILTPQANKYVNKIENAGSISINSPVALVDYLWGPSHLLPTGGTARFSSPLNLLHFLKISHLTIPQKEEVKNLISQASLLAEQEGMSAHAFSLKGWENYL